jgi:hypothetical protein
MLAPLLSHSPNPSATGRPGRHRCRWQKY